MDNKPYIFLGFDIRKINFEKNQLENLNEIRISIVTFNYDDVDEVLTLAVEIELDYDESKNNSILYSSGFKIMNDEVRNDLMIKDKVNDYVPLFLRIVLPFIRESLVSITKDTGGTVLLPTIDCLDITLEQTLILTARD